MVKSFEYQTATISYTIEGKGKPVVLLHGFGEDSKIWNLQVSFLKEYCLLIVPDLPGSGKSSLLFRESPVVSNEYSTDNSLLSTHDSRLTIHENISIENYADCIHALLRHENISSCIMLGHSMGGYITLAFAEKYPLLLTGLGLIHSTAFADSEEKKKNRARALN